MLLFCVVVVTFLVIFDILACLPAELFCVILLWVCVLLVK